MASDLIATVYVDGVPWVAGADVPKHVAARITNPAAWSGETARERQEAPPTPESAAEVPEASIAPAEPAAEGERAELQAMDKDDLVALAKARGVDARGSQAALVDRLSQG